MEKVQFGIEIDIPNFEYVRNARAIVIKGKAKSPVYLWILDSEVEIQDAQHLARAQTHKHISLEQSV